MGYFSGFFSDIQGTFNSTQNTSLVVRWLGLLVKTRQRCCRWTDYIKERTACVGVRVGWGGVFLRP